MHSVYFGSLQVIKNGTGSMEMILAEEYKPDKFNVQPERYCSFDVQGLHVTELQKWTVSLAFKVCMVVLV